MKKILGKIMAAVVLGSMFMMPVYAAPSVNDLQKDKEEAKEEIDALSEELSGILEKINKSEEKLIAKGEEIAKASKELEAAKAVEREQYEDMKLRIKYMYEQGDESLVEAFIAAENFTDFVNKAEYVQNVHYYDRNQLEEYIETRNKIIELVETLENEQKELEDIQSEYEQDELKIQKLINSKKDEISNLSAKIEEEMERIAEEQRQKEIEKNKELAEQYGYTGTGDTAVAQAIVSAAYGQLGVPYVWGGTTPGAGMDCSGLTQYCHGTAGISISRTSGGQGGSGQSVSNPKPGDIVCYPGHVGIYIGNGKMIHAPRTGEVIKIADVYGSPWYRRYW